MRNTFVSATLLAASVRALQITSPTKDQTVDLTAGFKVTWDRVDTDPSTAKLYLVNQAGGHTPYTRVIGDVDLTAGHFYVPTTEGVPNDFAYQFNLQGSTDQNTGILAQSQQFTVHSDNDATYGWGHPIPTTLPSNPGSYPPTPTNAGGITPQGTPQPDQPHECPNPQATGSSNPPGGGGGGDNTPYQYPTAPPKGSAAPTTASVPQPKPSGPVTAGASQVVVGSFVALVLGAVALVI